MMSKFYKNYLKKLTVTLSLLDSVQLYAKANRQAFYKVKISIFSKKYYKIY